MELSPEQQTQIQSAYENGKDIALVLKGEITDFGKHSTNDDGTENITSYFKSSLLGEIREE